MIMNLLNSNTWKNIILLKHLIHFVLEDFGSSSTLIRYLLIKICKELILTN